jgi:hypothetical protein
MDGHKPSNDVRKMMPADASKVSGVAEALRCAKSASLVTPVCHWSLIDHPVWALLDGILHLMQRSGAKTTGMD